MKYIVTPKETPDISGLNRAQIIEKLKDSVEIFVKRIEERFPEIQVKALGPLGAVIECSEKIAYEIKREFGCDIMPIPPEILEFD